MTAIQGLVDRPIAEGSTEHTFGYTRSEWLRGEGIVGAPIDFEHGQSSLKRDDRPLGHVTGTFVAQEPDGDWLGIYGQLVRNDPLVDALRQRAKTPSADKRKLGFSVRYRSRVACRPDGTRAITGKTLQEISMHRDPYHANALVQVMQGKEDSPQTEQPLHRLLFLDTKAPSPITVRSVFQLPEALSHIATGVKRKMATAAPPAMDTTPPAPAAAKASELVERAELLAKMEEMRQQNALVMQQLAEHKAKEEAATKLEADKKVLEQKQRADKRREEFMALKDFHKDIGLDLEDEATKASIDAVINQDTGEKLFQGYINSLKKMGEMKQLQSKIAEQSEALNIYEKKMRPAGQAQQPPATQPAAAKPVPLIMSSAEMQQKLATDPALQAQKVAVEARRNGLHPLTMDLNRVASFQLPLTLPPSRPTATGGAPGSALAAQPEPQVVQGLKGSEIHTGDAIQTKLGPVYVEPGVDDKAHAWNRAYSQPGYLTNAAGKTYSFEEMGINLGARDVRSLQNIHLNTGSGWGIPGGQQVSVKKANVARVIEVVDQGTY